MASFLAIHLTLSLLIITILPSHARDNQFFNKIPATTAATTIVAVPNTVDQPDFLPETETGHGLYGREPAELLPSATADAAAAEPKLPHHRYLPKNYNTKSYVTEPEDANGRTTTDTAASAIPEYANTLYDGEGNDQLTPEEKLAEYRNNNYNGERNDQLTPEEKLAEYRNNHYSGRRENNFDRAGSSGFGPQGMSDTRSLENGKYFYDINSEKYSSNHPYESMKNGRDNYFTNGDGGYEFNGAKNNDVGVRNAFNGNGRGNYYRNGENGYEFNGGRTSVGGYENQGDEGINENYRP